VSLQGRRRQRRLCRMNASNPGSTMGDRIAAPYKIPPHNWMSMSNLDWQDVFLHFDESDSAGCAVDAVIPPIWRIAVVVIRDAQAEA
jgi:hypothetical protein